MKNLVILFLLGIGLIFSGCTEDLMTSDETMTSLELKGAKKPASSLVGIGETVFTLTPPYFWNGTVDFGDQGEYNITFESLGKRPPHGHSMGSPYDETLFIYDKAISWEDVTDDDIYMKISISGIVALATSEFLGNGKVIEASGPLAEWMDCTMHEKGMVLWAESGLPSGAEFTLRFN